MSSLENISDDILYRIIDLLTARELRRLSLCSRKLHRRLKPLVDLPGYARRKHVRVNLSVPGAYSRLMEVSGDGSTVVATTAYEDYTTLLSRVDVSTQKVRTIYLGEPVETLHYLDVSESGDVFAIGGTNHHLYISSSRDILELHSVFINGGVQSLSCSRSGKYVCAAVSSSARLRKVDEDGTPAKWEYAALKCPSVILILTCEGQLLRRIASDRDPLQTRSRLFDGELPMHRPNIAAPLKAFFSWDDDLIVFESNDRAMSNDGSSQLGCHLYRYRAPLEAKGEPEELLDRNQWCTNCSSDIHSAREGFNNMRLVGDLAATRDEVAIVDAELPQVFLLKKNEVIRVDGRVIFQESLGEGTNTRVYLPKVSTPHSIPSAPLFILVKNRTISPSLRLTTLLDKQKDHGAIEHLPCSLLRQPTTLQPFHVPSIETHLKPFLGWTSVYSPPRDILQTQA